MELDIQGGKFERRFSLEFVVSTDVGMRREENQDAFGYFQTEKASLYIVADGMGGARGGAEASAMAVSIISSLCFDEQGTVTLDSLSESIVEANRIIYEQSQSDESLLGMGTTVVVLAILGDRSLIAHVGDSRIYFQRQGQLYQLTRDHTLVQDLVDSGAISEAQAANHPIAHMLTRSLGPMGNVEVEVKYLEDPLEVGDQFLLCCDGLYNHVSDEEICRALSALPARDAVPDLVRAANIGGGTDNITVEVVEVREKGQASKECLHPAEGQMQSLVSDAPSGEFEVRLKANGLQSIPADEKLIVKAPSVNGSDVREVTEEIRPSITVPGKGAAFDNIILGALKPRDESSEDTMNNAEVDLDSIKQEVPEEDSDDNWSNHVEDPQEELPVSEGIELRQIVPPQEEDSNPVETPDEELFEEEDLFEEEEEEVEEVLEERKEESGFIIEAPEDSYSYEEPLSEQVEERSRSGWLLPTLAILVGVGLATLGFQHFDTKRSPVIPSELSEEMVLEQELENDADKLIEKMSNWVPPQAKKEGRTEIPEKPKAVEDQKAWPELDPIKQAVEPDLPEISKDAPAVKPIRNSAAETQGEELDDEILDSPAVAINWDEEQSKIAELRLKAKRTVARDGKITGNLSALEIQAIVKEKGEVREALASINDKLLILELDSEEEIRQRIALISEELEEIGESIRQIKFTVNNAKRRQQQWEALALRVDEGEPFKVLREVSLSSARLRQERSDYRLMRSKYDEAVKAWRANRKDTRLAAGMAKLGRELKSQRAEIEKLIQLAIQTGIRQAEETVSESIVLLEELSAREARLNKQIGFGQTAGDPNSRFRDRQRDALLDSLNELTSRLEQLTAQVPDANEAQYRIGAARVKVGLAENR